MNQKSSVSKEQNNKHLKILEGVVRLPENRECADCCSKAPRWASVNLGIFICMQCSGIHRSLGTHISKVRSTTLDTWLPEQVAFMQAMSNQKSNAYWEANLPPNYDRSNIAEFIRAKYVERRWIPKDGTPPPTVIASKKISSSSKMGDQDDIPKKTRKLSLDEGILTKHEPEVVPPPAAARIRRSSLDMYNLALASAPPRGRGANAPTKPANGFPDISETFAPTPELWATFD